MDAQNCRKKLILSYFDAADTPARKVPAFGTAAQVRLAAGQLGRQSGKCSKLPVDEVLKILSRLRNLV